MTLFSANETARISIITWVIILNTYINENRFERKRVLYSDNDRSLRHLLVAGAQIFWRTRFQAKISRGHRIVANVAHYTHRLHWKLSDLFGHLAKSKTSNSNKLPHLHIIGNRPDNSLHYFDRSYDRPLQRWMDRYICVAQQRLYSKMFSKQGTCVIVLVDAVILVGLTTFPCPAGLAKVTLDPRRALCFTTFQQQTTAQMIGNLFFGLNVLLPLFIICLCYFRVFIAIRNNSFRVEGARLASVRIKEVRITKTVFAVLVGFLFCWIPAMVCNYLSFNMVNPRCPRQGELVFTFFLSVSSGINPFNYGTSCRSLRKEFLHPFRCGKTTRVKQTRAPWIR